MHRVPYAEAAVTRLLRGAARADGHAPLSENKRASMGSGQSRTGTWADGATMCVVGVAALQVSTGIWAVEVAVAPESRNPKMEEVAILASVGLIPGNAMRTVWAFRCDQVAAIERLGYRETRAVARLAGPLPKGKRRVRSGVTIDEMRWKDVAEIVAVNNRAFVGHPEQGALTEDLFASMAEREWFRPEGVLVARSGGTVVGFCVTKRESESVGEIFVIAVDPDCQSSGIGRALIAASSDLLRRHGSERMMLWVDAANEVAQGFYASLGLAEEFRTREFSPF